MADALLCLGRKGPLLMLAWTSALIYSLYNVPIAIEGTS